VADPRTLLADAARRLASVGIDSPRVDAELLLAAVLDLPRTRLVTLGDVPDAAALAGLTSYHNRYKVTMPFYVPPKLK